MTTPTNAGSGVATTLREIARELREHPEHWTQGAMAKDVYGLEVDPECEGATCWCALGLVNRASLLMADHRVAFDAINEAVDPAFRGRDLYPAAAFNDTPGRTALEVAAAFDKAAAIAESQP